MFLKFLVEPCLSFAVCSAHIEILTSAPVMMEMSVPTSARPECKLASIILATGNGLDMHATKRQDDSVDSALVQTHVLVLVSG